jgi:hypothetical protein
MGRRGASIYAIAHSPPFFNPEMDQCRGPSLCSNDPSISCLPDWLQANRPSPAAPIKMHLEIADLLRTIVIPDLDINLSAGCRA